MKRRRKKRVSISVVSGFAVLATIFGVAYYTGRLNPNSWAASSYSIRGVDVSHHQGAIDWSTVASDDVGFAYIKATEGGDFRDDQFTNNWTRAAANRVPRGAYHFFTFRTSGAIQAENFISTVPVDASALPPAVDLEYVGNAGVRPSVSKFQKELTDFLSRLRDTYNKEPVLYTTDDFYAQYLSDYPIKRLWIRNTLTKPLLPAARSWLFWQFADSGRVQGIATPVDLNVFSGDRTAFNALTIETRPRPSRHTQEKRRR